MDALLGIEIGGTKLQLVLADIEGTSVERRRFALARDQGASGIRECIERELPLLAGKSNVQGTTLESRCSGWAVDRRVREAVAIEPTGPLANLVRQSSGTEARHLSEALKQNDPLARRIVNEIAQDLAFGLSHVVHLFHPEVILLGGGLSRLGEPLRAETAAALDGNIMTVFKPAPDILLTRLAVDVGPIAEIELASEMT